MRIEEVQKGQIVANVGVIESKFAGIRVRPGTHGIVVSVACLDDVLVEFEKDRRSVTAPILCHPIELRPV